MSEKAKAIFAGLLLALVVGFSFLATKLMVLRTDAFISMAWRYNAAFVFMIFFLVFLKIRKVKLPRINLQKFKVAFLPSLFYVLFMLFQAIGLSTATSIESAIAFAIVPVFAILVSIFLIKEKPSFLQVFFMGLTTLSLIIMIILRTNIKSFSVLSMVILLISSFCLGTSQVYMRKYKAKISAFEMPCYYIITGFLIFNLFSFCRILFTGNIAKNFSEYFAVAKFYDFILSALYLGIFCIFLSAALMTFMTKILPAYQASIFGNLSTVISIFAGIIFLKEHFALYDIFLTAVIIIGVIGINSAKGERTIIENRK